MQNGKHLIIDALGCRHLDNKQVITDFMNALVRDIKMTPIRDAEIIEYNAPKNEDSGLTGILVLAESLISIHTYPEKKYMALDIFSCNPFSIETVLRFTRVVFRGELKYKELDRGLQLFNVYND